MTLEELEQRLQLRNLTPELKTMGQAEVCGGYASDLLSDVLAHAPPGGVLVTIQVHMNVIEVAVHAGLIGVIFAGGRTPDETVRQKALSEGIRLLTSPASTFEVVGQLVGLGLRGAGR